ncbi:MAG: TatD family deoxyribonuclease [Verrucomicrobia bacterium]|nr:MAG: TatD family deoxyribonuclease [Verrucomicrobiota bacterium]
MSLRFYDAHNHLQDERFGGRQAELLAACEREGVARMVVNGSCEEDWTQVLALAERFGRDAFHRVPLSPGEVGDAVERVPTIVIPSFGYHPWYIGERTSLWRENLIRFLDEVPSAVGEIGLDRWKPGLPYDGQEEVFVTQLSIAAERNLPVSIHCLQAWGRMLELLKASPRPARGFLLHSYGGPREMVKAFADLGAYFSLPGYYAHERKERQRETFLHVPADRLLIETDAPDQSLPSARERFPLTDAANGKPLNHPANLRAVYEFAAELFSEPMKTLADRAEQNFLRLFSLA